MPIILQYTAAYWVSENPVLSNEQEGIETDTGKKKYGDGVTAWTLLPYSGLIQVGRHVVVDPNFNKLIQLTLDSGDVDGSNDTFHFSGIPIVVFNSGAAKNPSTAYIQSENVIIFNPSDIPAIDDEIFAVGYPII